MSPWRLGWSVRVGGAATRWWRRRRCWRGSREKEAARRDRGNRGDGFGWVVGKEEKGSRGNWRDVGK